MPKLTMATLRRRAARFGACRGTDDLARLLLTDPVRLAILGEDPKYRTYLIPKKRRGTFRRIEDPRPALKTVQRRLNSYLQAVYHGRKTRAAYGFVVNPVDDPDPRNIKTNAERHVGARYLLNVDMRDFFHLIDRPAVEKMFYTPPVDLPKLTARRLAGLCCYLGRLPMGAPTSPVLSNLAAIPLDGKLEAFAAERGWIYTRYADDLTFSSDRYPITLADIGPLNETVKCFNFELNHAKSRLFGPGDELKEVTGLIIGPDRVALAPSYLHALRQGIAQLDSVVNAKYCVASGRATKTGWVEEIATQLRGRLAFASQVLDEDDPVRMELETRFAQALDPPLDYEPVAWLDFGYTLFNQPQL